MSIAPLSPEVIVLVGNPRAGSRTRAAGVAFAELVAGEPPTAVLELAELTGVTYAAPVAPTRPDPFAVERVRAARLLVVATPSYKGSFTGLLKLFLDQLPHRGLEGNVAVPLAVAASPRHAYATAADLGTVLAELGARVPVEVPLLESELASRDLRPSADTVRRALSDPVPVSSDGPGRSGARH